MADNSITETLAQRGAAYGDFREQGRITQNLKRAMQDSPNWGRIPSYMAEGLDMIQHKISRILNGDALYDDNIHDILGYAKLMQDRMKQDRDAGAVFQTGGDKLYPAFQLEENPSPPLSKSPFEERLAAALRELEELGFHEDRGALLNENEESPHKVLADYNGDGVKDPAYFNDPVRAYFAAQNKEKSGDE